MTERLKRIQSMAQRYHSLGVVKDDTMESINAAVAARRIPAVRNMTAGEIREVRTRYHFSQSGFANAIGMSVESISKWERGESKPNKAALRLINIIDKKGPDVLFA